MDLSKLMEQAKKMQENMQSSKEDLKKIKVEGTAGAGMVTVKMNGNLELLNVAIEDSVLEDKEMLEDLILAAVNHAISEAKAKSEAEMQKKASDALGGINLGGFKFPGM